MGVCAVFGAYRQQQTMAMSLHEPLTCSRHGNRFGGVPLDSWSRSKRCVGRRVGTLRLQAPKNRSKWGVHQIRTIFGTAVCCCYCKRSAREFLPLATKRTLDKHIFPPAQGTRHLLPHISSIGDVYRQAYTAEQVSCKRPEWSGSRYTEFFTLLCMRRKTNN